MLICVALIAHTQHKTYVGKKEVAATGDTAYYYTKSVMLLPGTDISGANGEFFILPIATNAPPSPDQNYVRTEVPLEPVTSAKSLTLKDADDKAVSFSYSDGMGRPTMNSAAETGQLYEDFVQAFTYNPNTGREDTTFLPFAKAYTKPGGFLSNAESETETFYNGTTNVPVDSKFFTKTSYDQRNRVSTMTGVGEAWHTGNKTTSYQYKIHNPAVDDSVDHWVIHNDLPKKDRLYASNELSVTLVTDVEGRQTRQLTDMRGLTISNQIHDSSTGEWYGSYNVYDDFGRIRFVIPPLLTKSLVDSVPTALQLDELVFQYEYDEEGRVKREKAPGAGWTEYVYDQWDRIVLSRHEAQQLNGNDSWTFVKYDGLNRQIFSGDVETNKTRSDLQTEAEASTTRAENSATDAIGYTIDQTFPDLTHNDYDDYEIRSISYYDSYGFLTNTNWDSEGHNFSFQSPTGFTGLNTTNVIDQSTGSKVRILGDTTWLNTVIYYDDDLRVLQSITENHIGGIDILTHELEWNGELTKMKLEHTSSSSSVDILSEYEYAHNGQLLKTWQTIDNGPRVLISELKYNVLDQVVEKNLHSADATSFLQSVDYAYNIKGWTSSINNADLDDGENDLFGMQYNYTDSKTVNSTPTSARYDGTVSSMEWKASDNQTSQFKKTITGYEYDDRTRLKSTNYATDNGGSWTGDANDYDMTATYDDNGNIESLTRMEGNDRIDSLNYEYFASSNKLKTVSDSEADAKGFDDKVGMLTEYEYDSMGNMIYDMNKEIVSIVYNHLQLVEMIEFFDTTRLHYTYDAVGNRLAKTITDKYDNTIARVDYVGLVEYLDNEINQVFTDEGRAYYQNGEYHYEYFLTDHQGNNRVAFGNLPDRFSYTATMETEHSSYEESEFTFPSNARTTAHNHTPLGNESMMLNGTQAGREVGAAKVLNIATGDEVEIDVWAKYTFNSWNNTSIGAINSLTSTVFTGASTGTGGEGSSTALGTALGNPAANNLFDGNTSGEPEAYLQYMFFDTTYSFVPGGSGFKAVGADAEGKFTKISSGTLTFNEPGYLFVYIVNESNQDAEVFFDDFHILHSSENTAFKVTQVNDFYPFGLATGRSWRDPAYIDPGMLYQSAYAQYDSLTGFYDFLSRSYDPVLGRFFAVDPAGQFSSPYTGMGNMPHWGTDPDGEFFGLAGLAAILVKGAVIGAGFGAASYSAQTAISGQSWNWGGFGRSVGMGAASGLASAGIGQAFQGVGSFGKELVRAGFHGVSQQGVGAAFGVDPSIGGFAAGFGGSLMGSGIEALGAGTGEMIAASALFGGGVSELSSSGTFWEGFTSAGIIASANHSLHSINSDGEIEVYVETDGIGHVYIVVDGEVYSYGRYLGSDSPELGDYGPVGPGVLMKLKGKAAQAWIKSRLDKSPTEVYTLQGDVDAIKVYFNRMFQDGTPIQDRPSQRVIDRYNLLSNNCTTNVCGGLRAGGVNISNIRTPIGFSSFMQFTNGRTIPITNPRIR